MEKANVITLPAKIERKKRAPKKKITWSDKTNAQPTIDCSLDALLPIRIQSVTENEAVKLWNEFVDRHHYLGYKRPIGSHLRYYIIDRQGRKLGCLLFAFATKSLSCRDQWIGWDSKARQKRLHLVINNNRFLIFPWTKVPCLASKVLSIATGQIVRDWEAHHGYRPVLVETFVDPTQYKGTCYQAANWQCIGKTQGRKSTRNSDEIAKKDIYVYPLTKVFQSVLINGEKASPLTKWQSPKGGNKMTNLTSHDPFIQLWQTIIGIITKVADNFDQQWQKRQRVINTMLLILFIFRLVFSKNTQGYSITIAELWDQCRTMNIALPQQKPVAASAFCTARTKLDETIFKTLNTEIIDTYKTTDTDEQWNQHRIFAVDGTKINLPRQLLAYGYRTPSDNAYYPQGLVSCLYQLKPKIPVDFDLVSHGDERKVALTHLNALRENDIVVYDRGYFSYAMLYAHLKRGVHVVFRLRGNQFKIIDEFIASDDIERVVTIKLSAQSQKEICLKCPDIKYTELQLRLIKYTRNGTTFILGTTLMDSQKYNVEAFADIYHSRWGIEELYKVSKVLLDVEDFHGQRERGVKQELFAHFVIITMSRIFSNQLDDGFSQEKNTTAKTFKVNLKNCLITIARKLEALFLKKTNLVKNTINAILNTISSVRQKVRPNRSYARQSKKPIKKWKATKKNKAASPKPVAG